MNDSNLVFKQRLEDIKKLRLAKYLTLADCHLLSSIKEQLFIYKLLVY